MTYAIYTDYTAYLQGRTALISSVDFPYYAVKASNIIKMHTFGNINETLEIPQEVKNCTCEVAEMIYAYKAGKTEAGNKTSEKVGNYSVSFADGQASKTATDKEILSVISEHLLMSGLIYRGCVVTNVYGY